MPVTLINKENRMRVFNLDHPSFAGDSTRMMVNVIEEAKDGGRYPRRVNKRVCGSLTLLAKEKRHNLPDQIIKVPQIENAIREGSLSCLIVRVEESPATVPVEPETTAKVEKPAPKEMATATTMENKRRSRKDKKG